MRTLQVFVHSLRKVDMRAMIGQTSTASVVVRGAMMSRRVAAYASHPDELQVHKWCIICGCVFDYLRARVIQTSYRCVNGLLFADLLDKVSTQ